jgi:hypothetical protein
MFHKNREPEWLIPEDTASAMLLQIQGSGYPAGSILVLMAILFQALIVTAAMITWAM